MKGIFRLFLALHTIVYRLTQGKFFNQVQGLPILLLTTIGRKSYKSRTLPLGYFMDGDQYIITASNAGFNTHPAWYHNLTKNPRVLVEVADRKMHADAVVVEPDKRDQLWATLVKMAPGYKSYEKRTNRVIPLVALRPVVNQ